MFAIWDRGALGFSGFFGLNNIRKSKCFHKTPASKTRKHTCVQAQSFFGRSKFPKTQTHVRTGAANFSAF